MNTTDKLVNVTRTLVENAVMSEICACGKEQRLATNVARAVESSTTTFVNPDSGYTLPDVLPLGDLAWPEELLSMCNTARFNVMSGLFPELNRVWFTIDNKLVLWDYRTRNELALFEQINQVIITVGEPVRPFEETFPPHITLLLPIATSSMCCLLGLCIVNEHDVNCLRIVNINFNVATETIITRIVCHQCTGRVFCASDNGNVYELQYAREGTLFVPKVRLVCFSYWLANKPILGQFSSLVHSVKETWTGPKPCIRDMVVDESRALLFTLDEANTITTWRIAAHGLRQLHCLRHKRSTALPFETTSSSVSSLSSLPFANRYRGLKSRRIDFIDNNVVDGDIMSKNRGNMDRYACGSSNNTNSNTYDLIKLFCVPSSDDSCALVAIAVNGEHFQYYVPNESIGDNYFTLELRSSTPAPALLADRNVQVCYASKHIILLANQSTNSQNDINMNKKYNDSDNNNSNVTEMTGNKCNEQLVAITLPNERNKPQSSYNENATLLRSSCVQSCDSLNSTTTINSNDNLCTISTTIRKRLQPLNSPLSTCNCNMNNNLHDNEETRKRKREEKDEQEEQNLEQQESRGKFCLCAQGISALAKVSDERRCSSNDLCWQVTSSSSRYLALHGSGLSLYMHIRPVDTLYLILCASFSEVNRNLLLRQFALMYTDADYAAMLLQIAIGALNVDTCSNAALLHRLFTPLLLPSSSSPHSISLLLQRNAEPITSSQTNTAISQVNIADNGENTTMTTRPHLTTPSLAELGQILVSHSTNINDEVNQNINYTNNNNKINVALDAKRVAREALLKSILAQCKIEERPMVNGTSANNNFSGVNNMYNQAQPSVSRVVTIKFSPFISAVNLYIARTCYNMWDVPLAQLIHSEDTLITPITVLSLLLSFLRSQGIDPTNQSTQRLRNAENDLRQLQYCELQQSSPSPSLLSQQRQQQQQQHQYLNKLTFILAPHIHRLQLETVKNVERFVLDQAYLLALKALQTALLLREVRYLPLPEEICTFTFAQVVRDEGVALRLGSFYTQTIVDAFERKFEESCTNNYCVTTDQCDGGNITTNGYRGEIGYGLPFGHTAVNNNKANTTMLMQWKERLERFASLQQRCNYFFSSADRQLCEVHSTLARITQGINLGSFSEVELHHWATTQVKPHAVAYWRSGALRRIAHELCELKYEKLAVEMLLYTAYQLDPEGRCLPLYYAERDNSANGSEDATTTTIIDGTTTAPNTMKSGNNNATMNDASALPGVSLWSWQNWSCAQIYQTKKEVLDLVLAVIDAAWQYHKSVADDLLGGPRTPGMLWQIEPRDKLAHYYMFDWMCALRADAGLAQSLRRTLVSSSSPFVESYLTEHMLTLKEEYNQFMRNVKGDVHEATAQSLRLALSSLSEIPASARLAFRVRCITDAMENARQSHSRELPQIEQQLRLIKAQQELCGIITTFVNSNAEQLQHTWEVNGVIVTEKEIAQEHRRLLNEKICEATTLLRIAGMYAHFGGLEIQLEILSASNVDDAVPFTVCLNRLYEMSVHDTIDVIARVESIETLTRRLFIKHREILTRRVPLTFMVCLLESYFYEAEPRGSRRAVDVLIGAGHVDPMELFVTYTKIVERLHLAANLTTAITSNNNTINVDFNNSESVDSIPCDYFHQVNVSTAYLIHSCAVVVEHMSNAVYKANNTFSSSSNSRMNNIVSAKPHMLIDAMRILHSYINKVTSLQGSRSDVASVDEHCAIEHAQQILQQIDATTSSTAQLSCY